MVRVLQHFEHTDSCYIMPEILLKFISETMYKRNYSFRMAIVDKKA